jgi:hypothetical protein
VIANTLYRYDEQVIGNTNAVSLGNYGKKRKDAGGKKINLGLKNKVTS